MDGVFLSKEALAERSHEEPGALSREWQVLSGGLIDGAAKSVATTISDLGNAAQALKKDPLDAAGNYISNHWSDAVAGATIAVIAPQKQLNKLLIAYSMKGIGVSTLRAGMYALDPAVSVADARNYYADAISHEGTAFVSSLPAAMAGGYLGRLGANAVFGKNLGVSDLFSSRGAHGEIVPPRVTVDTIKQNLSNLGYSVRPQPVRLVLSDMDNTMLDFSTYMSKGVEKGIADMSATLKKLGHPISEAELYRSIGNAMDKARSHDYPWSVEIALSKPLKVGEPGGMPVAEFTAKIVEPFWNTIDAARSTHMKLLPGVEESLIALKKKNLPVVIVSDAPAYAGLQRATALGLDRYVERMYALDNMKEPAGLSDALLAFGRQRVAKILSTPHQFKEFKAVPKEWEKPHTNSFLELFGKYGDRNGPLDPRKAIMIGDSRVKDIGVAHDSGMIASWRKDSPTNALWAEFGNPPKHIDDVLTRLREPPENQSAPGKKKVYWPPLEAATEYSSLLKYLSPKPDYGMLAGRFGSALIQARPPWQSALGANAFHLPPLELRK